MDRAHGAAPASIVLGASTVPANRPEIGPDAPGSRLPLEARKHLAHEHEPVAAGQPAPFHEGDLFADPAGHAGRERREDEGLVGIGQVPDGCGDLPGSQAHQPVLELDPGERPDRSREFLNRIHDPTVPARRRPGKAGVRRLPARIGLFLTRAR